MSHEKNRQNMKENLEIIRYIFKKDLGFGESKSNRNN